MGKSDTTGHDTSEALHSNLLLLQAYIDGELDAAAALDFEKRLSEDAMLAANYQRHRALSAAFASALRKDAPSQDLANRIKSISSWDERRWHERRFDWRAIAASFILAAALSSSLTYLAGRPDALVVVASDIVSEHQRALLANSTVDVASSDRHTVKPWFVQKLALSPPVIDLASDGFPLLGGRIDIVGGSAVPTLAYRHLEHLISLTIVTQTRSEAAVRSMTHNGFNIRTWQTGELSYWVVSDIEPTELDLFVSHLRKALMPH